MQTWNFREYFKVYIVNNYTKLILKKKITSKKLRFFRLFSIFPSFVYCNYIIG